MKPKETVQSLLNDVQNPTTVRNLCAENVTYVSLNYNNPDIHVSEFWIVDSFTPEAIFSEDENVAVFGRFTYTSTRLKKSVTTPFAIYCKVQSGKVTYMQFMEDTFATAASFRSGGAWTFQSDPRGGEVEI